MSKLILLIVGAAWLAVLLPPLVRARINKSPSMSVNHFRKHLSTLQNSNAGKPQAHLNGMSRGFASTTVRQPSHLSHMTDPILRPQGTRSHHTQSGEFFARELLRQRRQHTVVGLTTGTAAALFLAFTTGSIVLVYAFTISLIGLIGYCYVLVQLRIKRDNGGYLRPISRRSA